MARQSRKLTRPICKSFNLDLLSFKKFKDLIIIFTQNIFHDAIGFKNTRTGLEYTMEWYELGKLVSIYFFP